MFCPVSEPRCTICVGEQVFNSEVYSDSDDENDGSTPEVNKSSQNSEKHKYVFISFTDKALNNYVIWLRCLAFLNRQTMILGHLEEKNKYSKKCILFDGAQTRHFWVAFTNGFVLMLLISGDLESQPWLLVSLCKGEASFDRKMEIFL
jgi:hypothetical protein